MTTALVAILGGLLPTLVYVLLLWWLDRYEKEPVWLLATAFFWGAVPAALLSLVFELLLDMPLSAWGGDGMAANIIGATVGAPLIEESLKGIALVGLVVVFRREFDDVLDGIIYGAMIGFGFALTENVFAYFLPIASTEGLGVGTGNLLLRSIVFGMNHAFWTGIVGAAVGFGRQSRGALQLLLPVIGWCLAVLFHAIHNAGAMLSEQTACLSLGISIVVDYGGILMLLAIAFLFLRKESRWIDRSLGEEIERGVLGSADFQVLRSARQRVRQRWATLGKGGIAAYRVVGRYHQCATELALKKQQLRSYGDEGGNLAEIQRLRSELAELRAKAGPWL